MSTEAEAEDTWDQFETDDKTNVNAAPAEQPETASGPPEPSSFSASGLTDMLQNEPAVGSDESEWPQSPIPPMGCSSVAPVAESEKEMAIGATSGDGEHVESTCSFQMQRVKQNSHLEENQAAYNAGMAVGLTVETISGGLESPESQPQPQLRQEQQPSDEEAAVAETFWSTLTDVLLRVPMFGILQFFWFAFYVLAFGPNASVTVINLLFNVTRMHSALSYASSEYTRNWHCCIAAVVLIQTEQ